MKASSFIIVAVLLVSQPLWAAGSEQDLLLLYSNDVRGETAPCG